MDEPEPSFEELLADVHAARPGAAERLYALYAEHVRRAVRLRLPNRLRARFDSLDFCQDVWAAVFASPPQSDTFASPEQLAAFLMRIAYNKVNDAIRQHIGTQKYDAAAEKPLPDGDRDQEEHKLFTRDPTPSALAARRDAWDRLLDAFPPLHQQILRLLREGRTHEEAAAATGVTDRTVRRVVARAEYLGGKTT